MTRPHGHSLPLPMRRSLFCAMGPAHPLQVWPASWRSSSLSHRCATWSRPSPRQWLQSRPVSCTPRSAITIKFCGYASVPFCCRCRVRPADVQDYRYTSATVMGGFLRPRSRTLSSAGRCTPAARTQTALAPAAEQVVPRPDYAIGNRLRVECFWSGLSRRRCRAPFTESAPWIARWQHGPQVLAPDALHLDHAAAQLVVAVEAAPAHDLLRIRVQQADVLLHQPPALSKDNPPPHPCCASTSLRQMRRPRH